MLSAKKKYKVITISDKSYAEIKQDPYNKPYKNTIKPSLETLFDKRSDYIIFADGLGNIITKNVYRQGDEVYLEGTDEAGSREMRFKVISFSSWLYLVPCDDIA